MTKINGKKTFIRITNSDIYGELQALHERMDRSCTELKIVRWISTSALGISVGLAGLLLKGILPWK